jgi:hypothetical protein
MKNYKIVITLEFPHHEEYVVWEPEFYGQMKYSGIDVEKVLFNVEPQPIYATLELYENPNIQEIDVKVGDNIIRRQLLIGTKILPIIRY